MGLYYSFLNFLPSGDNKNKLLACHLTTSIFIYMYTYAQNLYVHARTVSLERDCFFFFLTQCIIFFCIRLGANFQMSFCACKRSFPPLTHS